MGDPASRSHRLLSDDSGRTRIEIEVDIEMDIKQMEMGC